MAVVVELPTILSPIQANTIPASLTTAFHLAAQFYGDPMQWTSIMKANPSLVNEDGFFDYQIAALTTINVPPAVSGAIADGIFNAFPVPVGTLGSDFNSDFDFRFGGSGGSGEDTSFGQLDFSHDENSGYISLVNP